MSWFNTSGIATLAKSTLTHAQNAIDKALDIHVDPTSEHIVTSTKDGTSTTGYAQDHESFFAAFGLDETQQLTKTNKPSDSKADKSIKSFIKDKNIESMWGSFTGSFFESGSSNCEESGKGYTARLPVLGLQPKKVASVRERHQTISLDQVVRQRSSNVVSSKQRTRSCSESDLRLTETKDSQIQRLTRAESLLSIYAFSSQKTDPAPIFTRKRIASGRKTKQCSSVKESSNVYLQNMEIDEVIQDEANLVKDASQSLQRSQNSRQPIHSSSESNKIDFAIESFTDAKEPILQMLLTSEMNMDKAIVDSAVKTVDELLPLEQSVGTTSLCSVSSSSTAGDSSGTLDESVGTLTTLSERDGHSSTTITPDLLADMTESTLPIGMSSSWDVANLPQDVDHQNATKNVSVEDVLQIDIPSSSQFSPTYMTALAPEEPLSRLQTESLFWEKTVLTETAEKSPETTGFVCYMLEAAMEKEPEQPTNANLDHSPDSTNSASSVTERSDAVKTEDSEQNSGHTSGDEIETTTSSDIEIISSPSAGGESGCEQHGSLSPIKQNCSWSRKVASRDCSDGSSLIVANSIRSESPASDTSSTKDSISAQYNFSSFFKPDVSFTTSGNGRGQRQHNRLDASSDESEGNQAKIEALIKKLSEVSMVLEAREAKVVNLSHENIELRELSKILKTQLQKVEEVRVADNRDVSTLTKEFTERFSTTEKKLQQALKEKDSLKLELLKATQEISARVSFAQVDEIKKEKDTQILELMQEGEKLSKQLLCYSNNVKKLRAKEKDNDVHIKQQRGKLEEQSRELDRLKKALDAKEDVEKNQIELIRQLTNVAQKYESDLANLKNQLEDSQEKQCSIQVALDTSYKELDELLHKNVEIDCRAQEAALSAEMLAKEELKACLEQVEHENRLQQENLMVQIKDLRVTLVRNEKQASRREDALRQDIANLQERLQEADGRNYEFNQNVSAATKPLFRQIENLQSTLNVQTTTWERLEHNLSVRLNEAQNQLAYATNKELASTERYAEMSSKVASLEAQISLLHQDRTTLQAEVMSLKEKLHLAHENTSKDSICSEAMKQSYAEELSRLKREMVMLEQQLNIEKTALEAEKRKNIVLTEQLKEKINSYETSRHSSPSPLANLSMRGSFSEQYAALCSHDQMYDSGSGISGMMSGRMNVYESLRSGSTATFVDSLQSQLKLRDGDIFQMQENINQLESVKESMMEELVKLTVRNEELEANIVSLKDQAKVHEDMQQKYNALLQMYGEISEETEELKLDLQDVKDMYKAQIDELMEKKH